MVQSKIYQEMSDAVYKLKSGETLKSIDISENESWIVEKTYSSNDSMARNDRFNENHAENVHTSDGYAGAIYRNSATNEIIVVNAGTDLRTFPGNLQDGFNDAEMAVGGIPLQYDSARQIMQDAMALSGGDKTKISVAGHSLGGSLAQLQAIEFGIPAVTFNAYGVGDLLKLDIKNSPLAQAGETVISLFNEVLFPDLFTAYNSGVNQNNIINFKMGDDIIGHSGNDIGTNVQVFDGGEDILTTALTSICVKYSLLKEHGIELFDLGASFDLRFSKIISGGAVDSNIILASGMSVYDPLVIDIDGDGVETVGLEAKVLFDHSSDGTKNATGWVGKDDALLVRDINNNGTIDTGRELFGENTLLANGQKAKSAYEALADIDSNKDGVVNSNDAKYNELKIWQDVNQDGISQSNELKTLTEAGISSLKVSPTNTTITNLNNGNSQVGTSTYTKTDGSTGISAGINFVSDEFVRKFTISVDTSQVANLPAHLTHG